MCGAERGWGRLLGCLRCTLLVPCGLGGPGWWWGSSGGSGGPRPHPRQGISPDGRKGLQKVGSRLHGKSPKVLVARAVTWPGFCSRPLWMKRGHAVPSQL